MKIPIHRFRDWLKNKSLKERTIEEYLYYFNKFLKYGSFTQENVSKFLSKKENMNGVSRSFLINFQKFLMINYKEFNIDKDMRIEIAEIELPKISGHQEQKLIKPLKKEQVLEIEKHFPNEKEKLMLLMSYFGGLRAGELLKIQVSSFDWEEWKKDINQIGECRVYGKGNKEGIAFFPSMLMKRIAKYIRSSNFQSLSSFLFLKGLENLDNVNLRNRVCLWEKKLKAAGVRAGIVQFDSEGKIVEDTNVHPHKLRHSWGYHLKNVMGLDIRDIKEILRHSSIISTQRYTYTEKSHIKKLLEGF